MSIPSALRKVLAVLGMAASIQGSVVKAAEKPTAPSAKKNSDWKVLFDGKTLDHWKPADFFKPGKIHIKDGAIVMEKGNQMTGIVYGRRDFPKMDYEVSLEGKKVNGNDFFCTTTFPVGHSYCSFVVGGWGGGVVGLSSINGADASENETGTTKEFREDQWYRVRIRVCRDKIEAWIDDSKMVDLETADRKIGIRVECAPCKPFGIATWNTTGAVRDIRFRMLSEVEKSAGKKKSDSKD